MLAIQAIRYFIGRKVVWLGFDLLLGAELQALGDPREALVLFPLSSVAPLEFQTTGPLEREKMKQRLSQHVLFRDRVRTPEVSPPKTSRHV
jgi:hypothetical protein